MTVSLGGKQAEVVADDVCCDVLDRPSGTARRGRPIACVEARKEVDERLSLDREKREDLLVPRPSEQGQVAGTRMRARRSAAVASVSARFGKAKRIFDRPRSARE